MEEPSNIKAAKLAYKKRLVEAVEWLQGEGHEEKPITAARIYRADAGSIRTSLKRANRRHRNKGQGGHNKTLLIHKPKQSRHTAC